ncbi:MAG: leucine-rich repeat domain-containing protein [Clostridia bacterium]|nr:leucine-rich repeat domain-containing protein [Clostridia bacterium]
MKGKRKIFAILLGAVASVCLAAGLAACDSSNEDGWGSVYTVETAYAEAQELGYSGTLEEFLASIQGEDGTGISSVYINSDGELVVTLSTGNNLYLGKVTGEDGTDGVDGADGSTWLTGSGVPDNENGNDGDLYLDTQSYDIYTKTEGAWSKIGNIKGADGNDGNDGNDGVGIESVELTATNGNVDTYTITLTNGKEYTFTVTNAEQTSADYTLTYEENDSGYTVTGISNRNATSVEIPATYNEKAVTAIGSKAFANCIYLEDITIPESVTSIGNYAFYNCSMLESIVLPEGVTSMGKGVLYGCDFLQSLTFSFNYDSTSYIGYLFGGNDYIYNYVYVPAALAKVTVTGSIIPDWAFESCYNIETVIIDNNVTTIGSYAFESCTSLSDITINGTITSLGQEAFYNTLYYNTSSNWENRVLYVGNCLVATKLALSGSYTVKDGTTVIAAWVFYGRSITDITIPGTVMNIGEYAFTNCFELTKVTTSKGVQNIGEGAFSGCSALEEINLPSSIISIGDSAFNGCSSLKEIILPDTITSIGSYAFNGCSSLTSVTISEGIESIDAYAFYGCSALTKITIPNSVTSIGEYAFYGCTNVASITFGTGVVSIGRNAFTDCTTITEITIPDNVVYIGIQAFFGCTSLKDITISTNIKLIGSNAFTDTAFYSDESNYEDGVLYLGTYLLRAKTTISGSYTVKAGTTVIASRAFEDCTELTSVTIASSVTIVGGSVFNRCTALNEVLFSSSANWYRTDENTFTNGTSTDLSDASTNATYFTDTYVGLYWYKVSD